MYSNWQQGVRPMSSCASHKTEYYPNVFTFARLMGKMVSNDSFDMHYVAVSDTETVLG